MQSGRAGISGSSAHQVATRCPKDNPSRYKNTLEGHFLRIIAPPTSQSSQSTHPPHRTSTPTTYILAMSFNNTLPEFNYDDITWLKNDNIYGDNLGFDEQGWDMSNVAGPSQTYTGAEVFGDFNNYPDFPSPSTAPTSLNPTHGVSPIEGKSDRTS